MGKRTDNPSAGRKPDSPAPADPAGDAHALLEVSGGDHPGILDEISQYVARRGAKIEAVRVVSLRGHFALLMLVAGDAASLGRVTGELHELMERTGVRAVYESPREPESGRFGGTCFHLRAGGGADADESTTIRETSNLLRVLNVNIRDVETRRTLGGGFDMRMDLDVPRDVPVGQLRGLIGQLLDRHPIQWELSAPVGEH